MAELPRNSDASKDVSNTGERQITDRKASGKINEIRREEPAKSDPKKADNTIRICYSRDLPDQS